MSRTKAIPIRAGKMIADEFGYDQVIIIARKVGLNGMEHVTTYGANKEHCDVAAATGRFLKHKIMGWPQESPTWRPIKTLGASLDAVIVSRPTDARLVYRATTAFRDATGVWRVFRSEGGMGPLSFTPTHWMPLPEPPT